MFNDIYSLFFNYKNNKINNSKFEINFCYAYSLNRFSSKNYSQEVSSEIDKDEPKKYIFINQINSFPELSFSSNFNILDKLTIDINNNLFDLLADLITENIILKRKKLIVFLFLLLFTKF